MSIRPLEVASYLRSRGSEETSSVALTSSIWERPATSGAGYEVLLPLNRHLADYPSRVDEVLAALEVAEDRFSEILSIFMSTSSDVVRANAPGA